MVVLYSYSDKDRATIAKYVGQFGVTAAATHFTRKFGRPVSKTTVHSIRKSCVEVVKEKSARDEELNPTRLELPPKNVVANYC